MDAYIPDSYANESDKIELYQEINSSETREQLLIIKQKVIDIYGKLPKEVELLFKKREIDILSKIAKISSLLEKSTSVELVLSDEYNKIRGIGNLLFESLLPYISFTKIAYRNKEFRITMNKLPTWVQDLSNLIEGLYNIIKNNNI
jgi:transcription-repair coupling factor (superfamily II helicase)